MDLIGHALSVSARRGCLEPVQPVRCGSTIRPYLRAGRDDTLNPPSVSEQVASAHGSADVRVIDGIGHQIPLEDARRTTRILTAFVAACFAPAKQAAS